MSNAHADGNVYAVGPEEVVDDCEIVTAIVYS